MMRNQNQISVDRSRRTRALITSRHLTTYDLTELDFTVSRYEFINHSATVAVSLTDSFRFH